MRTPACPSACTWTTATALRSARACIDGGFTSVMIDGIHYSFEENIALTKKVVDYAHDQGVVVEGELGRLAGVEDRRQCLGEQTASYTDPDAGGGICDAHGRGLSCHRHRHKPRRLQIQARHEAAASL